MNLDLITFCRDDGEKTGKLSLSELPRLRSECVSDTGEISWSLTGSMSQQIAGYPALRLSVTGVVNLQCQRCLTPYAFHLTSEPTFVVAKDESAAEQLDLLLHDEEVDVLVDSKTFDVIALIEDEALLALPSSPRHLVCPGDVTFEVPTEKESPFAILKEQFKGKK